MTDIVFDLPTKETPGYLRRQKQILEYKKRLQALGEDPEIIDEMIEFFLPYVSEPKDRDAAREALWDVTEEQFNMLLDTISGKADEVNP